MCREDSAGATRGLGHGYTGYIERRRDHWLTLPVQTVGSGCYWVTSASGGGGGKSLSLRFSLDSAAAACLPLCGPNVSGTGLDVGDIVTDDTSGSDVIHVSLTSAIESSV